jgi:peroxiredoxin
LVHHRLRMHLKRIAPLAAIVACLLAALPSSAAARFTLRDTEGVVHTTDEWSHARAVVVFFITTDCPLSNAYAPEMNRITQEYASRGVRVYAVQGDTTIPDVEVRKHAHEFAYTFPVLLDPSLILARDTGATVTPEVALLSPQGSVLYLGRIDNRVQDFGKVRYEATELDLRDALNDVLAGRPVAHPRTQAIGCSITYPR